MKSKKIFLAVAALFAFALPTFAQSAKSGKDSKVLVAYFSRADENYSVGTIKEGNTAKIAKIIAQKTGADLFEIKTQKPYPKSYKECTDVAMTEKNQNVRPALATDLTQEEIGKYETIFIGYPIWWGDMPMALYTFLESKNLDGKTIIPFCTHEGSGLSGTAGILKAMFKKSTVKDGLAVRGKTAQNDKAASEKAVDVWIKKAGF